MSLFLFSVTNTCTNSIFLMSPKMQMHILGCKSIILTKFGKIHSEVRSFCWCQNNISQYGSKLLNRWLMARAFSPSWMFFFHINVMWGKKCFDTHWCNDFNKFNIESFSFPYFCKVSHNSIKKFSEKYLKLYQGNILKPLISSVCYFFCQTFCQ